MMTRYRTLSVGGMKVFFREAGDPRNPTLLLLHGFPSSSFMFRELMPLLARDLHLIAPDYPGFGYTDTPPPSDFAYTFDNLATVVEGLLDALGINRFGIYIQDYGAPVGMRLATRRPTAIEAIVVQNGNAYDEGFSDAWAPLREGWWRGRSPELEATLLNAFIGPAGIKANWTAGARDPSAMCPDGWTLDASFMSMPHRREIQLDLLYDYRNNPPLYPSFHQMLRRHHPPLLIAWGERDPYFHSRRRPCVSPRSTRRGAALHRGRPLRAGRGSCAHRRADRRLLRPSGRTQSAPRRVERVAVALREKREWSPLLLGRVRGPERLIVELAQRLDGAPG